MARLIIQVGDQAKPAAIAFVGVFVESLGGSAHCHGLIIWRPRLVGRTWPPAAGSSA